MELYCGIDVAKDKHAVCVRNEKFDVVDKLEITNNLKGFRRFEERAPCKLSRLCIKQAKELGKLVAHMHFDVVFCSDRQLLKTGGIRKLGSQDGNTV